MNICLIGSTRFMDKYLSVNRELSIGGHVVYSVATRSSSADYKFQENEHNKEGRIVPDPNALTEDEKETLDLVHLVKILRSDLVVLITDSTGYIGQSTRREIKWCLMHQKQIMLPQHIKGMKDALESLQGSIREAVAEAAGIDLKTHIDVSKIKI